ncbi:MAG: hypothetical protein U1F10_08350 [Burkholderiales bacterium]
MRPRRLFAVACLLVLSSLAHAGGMPDRPRGGFALKDFAGDWVLASNSAGGVGINAGPGISSAVLRHITLDANGNGTENNGSFVFYVESGTIKEYTTVAGETVTLTLTDPANGAGTITITDTSSFHGMTAYNFLATRSRTGAVNKLFLILVSEFGNRVVVSGVLERQQEQ